MTSLISATPGTNLINAHGNVVAVIIAWQYLQGNMAFPLFACGRSGVAKEEAVFHPEGYVTHPASHKVFESVDLWTAYIDAEATVTDTSGQTEGTAPDTRAIVFGTKSYSTKSFWHWPTANAIFEVEGKEPYPDDPRVLKIKREEFADLKRGGAAKIDPHQGVIQEDENDHAGEPLETSAPDDDDMDVI
jgi:hypothetical protein